MYALWSVLHERKEPPSLLEIEIAEGKRALNDPMVIDYFSKIPRNAHPEKDAPNLPVSGALSLQNHDTDSISGAF
jgi:hypothetical protein